MPASCSWAHLCLFCSAEVLLAHLASMSLYSKAACHLYEYFFHIGLIYLLSYPPSPLSIIDILSWHFHSISHQSFFNLYISIAVDSTTQSLPSVVSRPPSINTT